MKEAKNSLNYVSCEEPEYICHPECANTISFHFGWIHLKLNHLNGILVHIGNWAPKTFFSLIGTRNKLFTSNYFFTRGDEWKM